MPATAHSAALGACVLLALLLVIGGCERGAQRRPLQRVALRLDSTHFGVTEAGARGPFAIIGDELRPVVAGLERIAVLEPQEVRGGREDLILPFTLHEPALGLPDASFAARTLALSDERLGLLSRMKELAGTEWIVLDEGWSLRRDPDDLRNASLHIQGGSIDERALVAVDAFRMPPHRLESSEFDVPPDARLEIGYGLAIPGSAGEEGQLDVRASLVCGQESPRVLHSQTIDAGDPTQSGWIDRVVRLPSSPEPCRLRLESRGSADESLAAVWSVPRIVTPRGPEPERTPRGLVLISLDTLRADHLSGYGYARETSPVIDRELVARGATFSDVSTTYPRTNIAHQSLFTGLYPGPLGEQPGFLPATSSLRTLAETLAARGLETAAVTEGGLLSWRQGFWYGFDRFTERTGTGRASETFADGVRYLESARDREFFLFLHTYQVHAPYDPADAVVELFRDDEAAVGDSSAVPERYRADHDDYDREIRETDALLAELLARIDSLGLSERTYVVLVSDHGESFGEHRVIQHGFSPHQEEIRVPLVVRGPGIPAGLRIDAPASLVDLVPTLLDVLDVAPMPQAQGVSLASLLRGGEAPPERPLFFEWSAGRLTPRGVRVGQWKILQKDPEKGRVALYDLEADPNERSPIRGPHPMRKRGAELLEAYGIESAERAAALAAPDAEPLHDAVSERVQDALRALGYLDRHPERDRASEKTRP